MTPLKEQISELVELTKLYLLQEYKTEDRLYAHPENYQYFKKLASIKKEVKEVKYLAPNPPPVPHTAISQPVNIRIPEKSPVKKEEIKLTPSINSEIVPLKNEETKLAEAINAKNEFFKFEKMQSPRPTDFSELRHIIKEQAPGLKINDKTLSPISPQAEILLLATLGSPLGQNLLNNMHQAINQHIAPALFIEASSSKLTEEWIAFFFKYTLKLIVIPQTDLDVLPALKILFKNNEKGQTFLHTIPTLLIPNPEALHQQPLLKQNVWNSLKSYSKPKFR